VKSLDEIREALDPQGACDGLPFMPEMIRYCGRTFHVGRRVEHVFIDHLGKVARLENTVILEGLRCDGASHDDCQMGCQLLWKDDWLSPAESESDDPAKPSDAAAPIGQDLELTTEVDGKLWCQATRLEHITTPLPWWDLRQYGRGVLAHNLTPIDLLRMFGLLLVNKLRWWCGKPALGMLSGPRKQTVHESLGLEPGEWVEVKGRGEIEATLDAHGKHRGMAFVPEMAQFCGRRFRVAKRVEKMIDEGSGRMRKLRDTVALETVTCLGLAQRRCPRGCFHLWRESWLKRVDPHPETANSAANESQPRFTPLPILDLPALPSGQESTTS
jgi:hypothetical protein